MLNNSCEESDENRVSVNRSGGKLRKRSSVVDLTSTGSNPMLQRVVQLNPTPLLENSANINAQQAPNAPGHGNNQRILKSHSAPIQRRRPNQNNNGSYTQEANSFCLVSPLIKFKSRCDLQQKDNFSSLSDELILSVFQWIPKRYLVKCALASRRFCRLAFDEMLWKRLDLGGKKLAESTIHRLLDRGVMLIRLARADIENDLCPLSPQTRLLLYPKSSLSKLTHLDLSLAVYFTADVVAGVLERCRHLKALSLENGKLNSRGCFGIAQNPDLELMNLAMCQGLDFDGLEAILEGCRKLREVNIGWAYMTRDMQTLLCSRLPNTVKRLNISGYRSDDALNDSDIRQLVQSCPFMTEVDISDCTQVKNAGLDTLMNELDQLETLSASRCYGIEPVSYMYCKDLKELNVFGCVTEEGMKVLENRLKGAKLNPSPFSTIARPTVGIRRTSIWEQRVRDE